MLLVQALGELILTEQTPVVPTAPPVLGVGFVVGVDVEFVLLFFEQPASNSAKKTKKANERFLFIL